MKFIRMLAIAAGLFFSTNVFALSGLEFIKLTGSEQIDELKPYVFNFVSQGFKNVPSEVHLIFLIRDFVLKNGAGNKPLEGIVKEVAAADGMTR